MLKDSLACVTGLSKGTEPAKLLRVPLISCGHCCRGLRAWPQRLAEKFASRASHSPGLFSATASREHLHHLHRELWPRCFHAFCVRRSRSRRAEWSHLQQFCWELPTSPRCLCPPSSGWWQRLSPELEATSFLKILPRATMTAVKMMTRSRDVISSFISIFPQEREKLR